MGDPVVEKAVLALDDRTVSLPDRVEAVEGKVRADQVETIREHGLPADLIAAETSALRRHSPARNRWPEVDAVDKRVGELDQRQAETNTALRELHDREQAAPNADAAVLSEWEFNDRKGPRPEATLPAIQARIEELRAESEALNLAIGRVLADKAAHVDKHRGRLVKKAEDHTDEKLTRCLELIDQLEAARDDLRAARHAAVWARLYPDEKASAEPRDSLAGGRWPQACPHAAGRQRRGVACPHVRRVARGRPLSQRGSHTRAEAHHRGPRPAPAAEHGVARHARSQGQADEGSGRMGKPAMIGPLERYHRRPKRDKTLDPPPRRCSSPLCATGWEAREGGPYCLECHFRISDRAEALRVRNDTPKAA
jgi:hypothetical protein